MPDNNATRHAILGHLALRDWSAYELTRSIRRTLHWFWPRAESAIYAEMKRLQKDGLARRREEPAADGSARQRAVYAITARGRRALAEWLATPDEGMALHIAPLLRLHLARFGTKEDLVAAITNLNETAARLLSDGRTVAGEFAEGRHLLQDEAHIRGLLFDALWSVGQALDASSRRALEEIARWPTLEGDKAAKTRGVERMRDALRPTRRGEAFANPASDDT
jgi:PadR family transcriptional regulator, regulatory protein AphA